MPTLILRYDAPMQSWGTSLKLRDHGTDAYPSKSGTVGLIASAMGIRRDDDAAVTRLSGSLRFGVRIDDPGETLRDFQTEEFNPDKPPKIGSRFYLSGAAFTCGVSGSRETLEAVRDALLHPANALFLGRRGCPPTVNLVGDIRDAGLEEALETEPSVFPNPWNDRSSASVSGMRILVETDDPCGQAVHDRPLSFSPFCRRYGVRFIKELEARAAENTEKDTEEETEKEAEKEGGPADVPEQDLA